MNSNLPTHSHEAHGQLPPAVSLWPGRALAAAVILVIAALFLLPRAFGRSEGLLAGAFAVLAAGGAFWLFLREQAFARRFAALTDAEEKLRDEAASAARTRDEVLAIVSHDLRSPLSAISLAAKLLSGDATAEKRARHTSMIIRSVSRMNRLIQDLLDVSRLDSGQALTLRKEEFDPGALVEDVAADYEEEAALKGISFTLDIADSLPDLVLDRHRLAQAVGIYLENAIKHTPELGSVGVRAEIEAEEVVLTVSSGGAAIPAKDAESIFKPYWQVGRPAAQGSGLSLAIVKGIAEAHGGSAGVHTRAGDGASFYLRLPAVAAAPAAEPGNVEVPAGLNASRNKAAALPQ